MESKGYIQAVLSAMESDFLLETMQGKGITHYFKAISGIENHLAEGKTGTAEKLLQKLGCEPAETVIIGDTLHDAEIARDLKIRCILVSRGHQSHDRLISSGYPVIKGITGLYEIL